jgi:PAS domain S-box-containing protein
MVTLAPIGIDIDIEDHKRAEETLRASKHDIRYVIDSIPGLVALLTPAGECEAVNRQLLEYCGRTLDEVKFWGTSATVHADDLPRVVQLFTESITSGDPYDFEVRIRRFDGAYRWFQVRALPLRDTDGRIARWCALHTDIDERKRAEEALKRREALLAGIEVSRTSDSNRFHHGPKGGSYPRKHSHKTNMFLKLATNKMNAARTVGLPLMFPATPVVFVVDDDVSIRESLELLIGNQGWRVETFESAQAFLARDRIFVPNCLVLDVSLPDLNGLDLQKRIAAERSDMPIIFIAGRGDVPTTVQAMKAGAVEFLTKPFRDEALLDAIRQAIERSRAALGREEEMRGLRERYASLTRREQQVMARVVSGLLNKQIGAELGISEITVKAHRGKVMQKMLADSLPELVKMAARLWIGTA